jgi:hypothetical protein
MGGRTGGWDHRDQDAFIRAWTQIGTALVCDEKDNSDNDNAIMMMMMMVKI